MRKSLLKLLWAGCVLSSALTLNAADKYWNSTSQWSNGEWSSDGFLLSFTWNWTDGQTPTADDDLYVIVDDATRGYWTWDSETKYWSYSDTSSTKYYQIDISSGVSQYNSLTISNTFMDETVNTDPIYDATGSVYPQSSTATSYGYQGALEVLADPGSFSHLKIGSTDSVTTEFTGGALTLSGSFRLAGTTTSKLFVEAGDVYIYSTNWQRQSALGSYSAYSAGSAALAENRELIYTTAFQVDDIKVIGSGFFQFQNVGTVVGTYDGDDYRYETTIGSIQFLDSTGESYSSGTLRISGAIDIDVGYLRGAASSYCSIQFMSGTEMKDADGNVMYYDNGDTMYYAQTLTLTADDTGGSWDASFVVASGTAERTIEIASGAVQTFTWNYATSAPNLNDSNLIYSDASTYLYYLMTYDVAGKLSLNSSPGLKMIVRDGGVISNYDGNSVEMKTLTLEGGAMLELTTVTDGFAIVITGLTEEDMSYGLTEDYGFYKADDFIDGVDLITICLTDVVDYGDETYDILSYTATDFTTSDFQMVTTDGETYTVIDGMFIMENGVLSFTAVPEPSTYALIFGSLALGFVLYRRRKA